ncbi:DUF932 domain-containing protein [candidate division WOR-3 bacterium]|nr:DUF932 domain-containing protein [candidate division WOR-3 bacterium]
MQIPTPNTQTPSQTPNANWVEFKSTMLNNINVELFGTKSVHILLPTGERLVIKNTALTQLLHLMDLSRKDMKAIVNELPQRVKDFIETRNDIVFSALQIAPKVFYVYRVTTEEYQAIPHRILFDFVKRYLESRGLKVPMKVVRYTRRTVAYFKIAEYPLKYARKNDALLFYLGVSNANTGHHSIKIFGYAQILLCANGLVDDEITARVRIIHKSTVEEILKKVAEAIDQVLEIARKRFPNVARKIEELQEIPVSNDAIIAWLRYIKEKVPRKYWSWFNKVLSEYEREFGYSAETIFQTLTYFIPRLQKRNESLAEFLNKEANKLLESPKEYLAAVAAAR